MKETKAEKVAYEFGGPLGCFFIITYSHFLPYYFYLALQNSKGGLIYPSEFSIQGLSSFFNGNLKYLYENAFPNFYSVSLYLGILEN
jgi:hypothetical protein